MISLLIADDHTIFRQGLTKLLQKPNEISIVSEVSNGIDAWDNIKNILPDIAVLDFSMPGLNGLQVAEMVLHNNISTHIIMLTMFDEPSLAIRSKNLQVKGYVLKDNTIDELLLAIREVADGRTYMSPVIKEKLKNYNTKSILSRRETTVLKLISQGMTNREIANQLKLSHKTIDTYRCRLMSKLNLHSVADLTKHAVKIGLETS